MAGTYPASPIPRATILRSVSPTFVSVSHALNTQRRSRDAQRFSLELIYPSAQTWAVWAPLWAFLMAQGGRFDSFSYVLPVGIMPAGGTWSGTPLVNGASQTGSTINLDGFTLSDPDVALAGDLIRFGTQKKVYTVTADASADGAGAATVSIWPPLIASPGDGDAVEIHKSSGGITFTMSLQDDDLELSLDHCVQYGATVSMFESVDD